jgi:hypothetical protein
LPPGAKRAEVPASFLLTGAGPPETCSIARPSRSRWGMSGGQTRYFVYRGEDYTELGRHERMATNQRDLLEKIRSLPADKLAEVEDFVDSLRLRDDDRSLGQAAAYLSEAAFARVWDNPDDAAYDTL